MKRSTTNSPVVDSRDRNVSEPALQGPQSVDALLHEHADMGIPHFQRGLVWEDENVALLLESLYHGTPCGSIVLWTPPPDLAARVAAKPAKYIIVDGQQRIRSLHEVFSTAPETYGATDLESESPDATPDECEEADAEQGSQRVWCLNLGRIPELKHLFRGGERFSLFRHTTDPRDYWSESALRTGPGVSTQDVQAVLPLTWFLDHSDEEIRELVGRGPDAAISQAVLAVLENPEVKLRVRQMRVAPVFQVALLNSAFHLTDVIGVYNRINSAGKRVESEEKAFANLVGASDDGEVSRALEQFFRAIHGESSDDRDDWLRRQRENRFGFRLFMRVFTIALAYHSDRSLGSSGLSFESVNPRVLAKASPYLRQLLATTVKVLEDVSKIIRTNLHCDDFRMLPDTSSLWPVFQLLIRFPESKQADDVLASMILRLMLADLPKRELLKLCGQINTATDASEAFSAVDGCRALSAETIRRSIKDGIASAQSLTNRHTLMLYWLARHRSAKDFDYDANPVKNPQELRKRYPVEPDLCEEVAAQKQHIVPYRHLKYLYDLEGGGRPGTHEVNDIGNLTYISAVLNGGRIGIGSKPLNLIDEPSDNRMAHLVQDEGGTLLAAFSSACLKGDAKGARKNAKARYREFCRLRRKLIVDAIVEWDKTLRTAIPSLAVTTAQPSARTRRPGRVRSDP